MSHWDDVAEGPDEIDYSYRDNPITPHPPHTRFSSLLTTENGRIFAHTRPIDKSGVPIEAQDDAPSYDTSGGRLTPPRRPTGGDDGASRLSPTTFGIVPARWEN